MSENRKNLQYSKEDIAKALKEVQEVGISFRKAGEKYGIPHSTLRNRFNRRHTGKVGSSLILLDEEEDQLVWWIKSHAEAGYPLQRYEIFKAVKEICEEFPERLRKFKNCKLKLEFNGKAWQ